MFFFYFPRRFSNFLYSFYQLLRSHPVFPETFFSNFLGLPPILLFFLGLLGPPPPLFSPNFLGFTLSPNFTLLPPNFLENQPAYLLQHFPTFSFLTILPPPLLVPSPPSYPHSSQPPSLSSLFPPSPSPPSFPPSLPSLLSSSFLAHALLPSHPPPKAGGAVAWRWC